MVEPKKALRTIDLHPNEGEMIKATETIDIVGVDKLTLQDQRVWNYLLENAHGPELGEFDRDFTIDLTPLRGGHNSNDRLEETIERLMQTIARCRAHDGSVVRFQLLGGNNMGDPMRPRGEMTYSFDKRLIEVLQNSGTFGKLELSVMEAFTSKYALALYEHMSRKVNLKHVWMAEYSVQEVRDILRVGKDQLKAFGNLKQRALVPAIEEVNYWARFKLAVSYKKRGQKVDKIVFNWTPKSGEAVHEIAEELKKSKVGRQARRRKAVETIHIIETPDDMDDSELPLN